MITEREFAMRLYNTIVSQYPNVHQFCLANEWNHAQLYNWLNGGMFPSALNLIKLSNQLNVSIDYLLDNEKKGGDEK